MSTEWKSTSPDLENASQNNTAFPSLSKSKNSSIMDKNMNDETSVSIDPNSSTSAMTNGHNVFSCSSGRKTSLNSPDPTAYIAKARVTRPTPPPPSYNPMQFVQIKPCSLYQTAQQQLKKVEEVKKNKEIKKEEPEEWQNNLDNWKSSRRKRVEHIIDRVVEVKKLELEEHDRTKKKSKTFSEMIEERGDRGVRVGRTKLVSLAVYNEIESNDLSDLGIGTRSASGKSSVSDDYENNSVAIENTDLEKVILSHEKKNSTTCEYMSSPDYDTSTSTAPVISPDPCEYTYESAIQDYKQRVSKTTSGGSSKFKYQSNNKKKIISYLTIPNESISEQRNTDTIPLYVARRGCKIEKQLTEFEVHLPNNGQALLENNKINLPKIDISKRKKIFECASNKNANSNGQNSSGSNESKSHGSSVDPRVILRDNFKFGEPATVKKGVKPLSGDITSFKKTIEQQNKSVNSVSDMSKTVNTKISETPLPPLKYRDISLKNVETKEDIKKALVVYVDASQLDIMKDDKENAKQCYRNKKNKQSTCIKSFELEPQTADNKKIELNRNDSGIHTSVEIEDTFISDQKLRNQEQVQPLNEATAALSIEEQNLVQAAKAVNTIENVFAKLPIASNQTDMEVTTTISAATNDQPCEMEFSINEAVEIALGAIDTEANTILVNKKNRTAKATKTIMNGDINCKQKTAIDLSDDFKEKYESNAYQQLYSYKSPLEQEFIKNKNKDEQNEKHEQKIRIEPIYENISTTPTRVGAEIKTIPAHKITTNQSEIDHDNNEERNNTKYVGSIVYSLELLTSAYSVKQQHQLDKSSSPIPPPPLLPIEDDEPYYQVPKCVEPYYDAPTHLRPIPVYENIEVVFNGSENAILTPNLSSTVPEMEPPKEKPPPPPADKSPTIDDIECLNYGDKWSSENTYEIIYSGLSNNLPSEKTSDNLHTSPLINRMNSTKRIKKELRHKRSSFLGIDRELDDDLEHYFKLTTAPPPNMAQLLQEERRLEKQLYIKAGLCDSSDTGDSRDSGVSENHSRQSSEPYTNSFEEMGRSQEPTPCLNSNYIMNAKELIYQNNVHLLTTQTPLLQTVKGNSAESWTESATAAAAASKSLTEATATANAKILSIEEKIREQEEVLRLERELVQFEQEELKRHRENLMIRENLARRELQHGAKMLMSANRHSLQDLNGKNCFHATGVHYATCSLPLTQGNPQYFHSMHDQTQQIYANVTNSKQKYYQADTSFRKSMSDINEFSKFLIQSAPQNLHIPSSNPIRVIQVSSANSYDDFIRQRYSLNKQQYDGSLVTITNPTSMTTSANSKSDETLYPNNHLNQSQSALNVSASGVTNTQTLSNLPNRNMLHLNMSRSTLHALSATPKPKYTDVWVQVQNRKSFESYLSHNTVRPSVFLQKSKSVQDAYSYNNGKNNQWIMPEPDQMRQKTGSSSHMQEQNNGKPLPDSVIQTLTERVQSKGIGERKRFENSKNTNIEMPAFHITTYQQHGLQRQRKILMVPYGSNQCSTTHDLDVRNPIAAQTSVMCQDKILSVSGRKKCSHCGEELGRGAAMIIESLFLFYHINCFKCCVCHVQLGDGLNGTDVRVRNQKLHCQNCYSSDDGIKFSCV